MDYELSAQDVIDALMLQRNEALNELARCQAMIRTLQKRAGNGAFAPHDVSEERRYGNTGELPAEPR